MQDAIKYICLTAIAIACIVVAGIVREATLVTVLASIASACVGAMGGLAVQSRVINGGSTTTTDSTPK
jgi:hypothetical protein